VAFLWSAEAQRVFVRHGFGAVHQGVFEETIKKETETPEDLWNISDLGGWERVSSTFFVPQGIFDQVMENVYAAR